MQKLKRKKLWSRQRKRPKLLKSLYEQNILEKESQKMETINDEEVHLAKEKKEIDAEF